MKVLVTGAGGFLGRAVAAHCVDAGHEVLAMVRPSSRNAPEGTAMIVGDLRQTGAWCHGLEGIEAVIHCAAAASGDLPTQLAGTMLATENLLAELPATVRRFIHISSLSVYDFDAPPTFGSLDEQTSLERCPMRRDPYTATKLAQEKLVRDWCEAREVPLTVIRPGAIYGPGKNWDYGAALRTLHFDFIFAPLSRMRLTYVDNCADAIELALHGPTGTYDIVDDEQPDHWAFHRSCRKSGGKTRLAVLVPYWAVLGLGLSARIASKLFFGGKARLPEMLDLPRQRVRWRPLRYLNDAAKKELGWQPRVTLAEGISRTIAGEGDGR